MHSYRPTTERVVTGANVRVSLDRATFQALGGANTELELRVAGLPGVVLKNATLASSDDEPCENGVPFIDVYRDGAVVLLPPIELAGAHRLRLVFNGRDTTDGALKKASSLDLELTSAAGVSCQRVPLGADKRDVAWRLEAPDPGLLASLGARAFPFRTSSVRGFEPLWTANVREGAVLGKNRVWLEVQGGTDRSGDYTLVLLG
ncbi:MAG TPA: hypothetical protein VGM29_09080, partial [Polyangiaceae bacterium]